MSGKRGYKWVDLTGQRFGRWLVLGYAGKNAKGSSIWDCRCDCGMLRTGIATGTLRSGHSMSCGCLKAEMVSERSFQNLVGQKFNRLTVLRCAGRNEQRKAIWDCQCDCGNMMLNVTTTGLRGSHTRSCGCLQRETVSRLMKGRFKTHGLSHLKEYKIWAGMLARCRNPKANSYSTYGGRGIKVCERWEKSFVAFHEDMGLRPSPQHSLDRIDHNGDYCKENCRWATIHEQMRNRNDNRVIEHEGQKLTLAEWVEKTGLTQGAILSRLKRGWSVEKTLTVPAGKGGRPLKPRPQKNRNVVRPPTPGIQPPPRGGGVGA